MNWKDSIWFFDIDDTIIDTAGSNATAADGIKQKFSKIYGDTVGLDVLKEYLNVFNLMLAGYRIKNESEWDSLSEKKTDFENLLKTIKILQNPIQEKWGNIKKWSREVFIKIAADRVGINPNGELIKNSASAYWTNISKKTVIFDGAKKLIDKINSEDRPIFLITSSDGRLVMNENGQFTYDPKYSEILKRDRVELLRQRGIKYNLLTIGDPEDKPSVEFFKKGIREGEQYLKHEIDIQNCVMVGDSYSGDLQTPREQMGFGLTVLFQKDSPGTFRESDNYIRTNNLDALITVIN